MSNSVHSSDMLKNEGTRRWLFDVSKPRKKKDTHFFLELYKLGCECKS